MEVFCFLQSVAEGSREVVLLSLCTPITETTDINRGTGTTGENSGSNSRITSPQEDVPGGGNQSKEQDPVAVVKSSSF